MTRVLTASDHVAEGNKAFDKSDFENAVQQYTRALEVDPSRYDVLVKRSVSHQRAGRNEESLRDANDCLRLVAGKRALVKTEAKALLRKGIAQYNLKRFGNAFASFASAKEKDPDKIVDVWLKKCEAEFDKGAPKTVVEEPELQGQASNAEPADGAAGNVPGSSLSTGACAAPAGSSMCASGNLPKVRHEWYQSDNFVMISIFVKNAPKTSVEVHFNERTLSVCFPLPNGSTFSLELDPLANEIVPSESTFEVLSTKVELKLKKKIGMLKWGALEGEEDVLSASRAEPSDVEEATPAYPSSAKNRKDWNKLEKEVEEEKPEGDAALNALFQQIYRDASDDTRRAMMKSFTESNGTCLSTNWEDVGKKKVECSPPDGMEAKKFDI